MSNAPFAPLDLPQVSATDHVYRAVYDAVISLKLLPGAKLSESEIASQMNVSRQPVRDAFFRLSNQGFLLIRPQRATLVTRISETAVRNAVFVRTALEVACLHAAAARLRSRDVTDLRACLDRQRTQLSEADPSEFHASDDAFHALICEIAEQSHAWSLIREHKAHMDRVRYLTLSSPRQERVLDEHGQILNALEAGTPGVAEDLLRAHLGAIDAELPGIRAAHSDYFEPEAQSGL